MSNSIISQETWDNMPDNEKQKIIESYNSFSDAPGDLNYWVKAELEAIFGKENLQPNKKIKIWVDVAIHKSEIWDEIHKVINAISGCSRIGNKQLNHLVASIQIQKLIELGYGGVITDEEWANEHLVKYNIDYISGAIAYNDVTDNYSHISFHTDEQREEFMSHPENVALVKHYYMMPNE